MVRKITLVAMALIVMSLVLIQCSDDDDNPTNSSTDVPASLVGTWWWQSALMNGVPQQFSDINNVDTSETMSLTVNANNTWSMAEYYQSQEVYTQSGSCTASGSNLHVIIENEDGSPVSPPDTADVLWQVTGDVMVMTQSEILVTDTLVLVTTWIRAALP